MSSSDKLVGTIFTATYVGMVVWNVAMLWNVLSLFVYFVSQYIYSHLIATPCCTMFTIIIVSPITSAASAWGNNEGVPDPSQLYFVLKMTCDDCRSCVVARCWSGNEPSAASGGLLLSSHECHAGHDPSRKCSCHSNNPHVHFRNDDWCGKSCDTHLNKCKVCILTDYHAFIGLQLVMWCGHKYNWYG